MALPLYTGASWDALLGDTESEDALFAKGELVSYALTRYLGAHGGLSHAAGLASVLPCDLGLMDELELLRVLGGLNGLDGEGVAEVLGGYLGELIEGKDFDGEGRVALWRGLVGSLVHEGIRYDFRTQHGDGNAVVSGEDLWVGYQVVYSEGDFVVRGHRYAVGRDVVSGGVLPMKDAGEAGLVLLEATPLTGLAGVSRYNDPCHYVGHGGGGGQGGGGGVDDDEMEKNIVNGPMLVPAPGASNCALAGPGVLDGVRVVRFHLADRNEGGLFSGKSEVFLSASMWRSNAISGTLLTNTEGVHSLWSIGNKQCNLSFGKTLANVAKGDIGVGTGAVITVPAGNDWTIVSEGFCQGLGYDRMMVTIYEKDQIIGGEDYLVSFGHHTWLAAQVDTCLYHFSPATMASDAWFSNTYFDITPADFSNNNGRLWLVEVPGGFQKHTVQPSNHYSWFELETF